MKRDLVLSGALHAAIVTGLVLWGAGWIETPRVPSAITVFLIELVGSGAQPAMSPQKRAATMEPVVAPAPAPAERPRPAAAHVSRAARLDGPERPVAIATQPVSGTPAAVSPIARAPGAPRGEAAGPEVDRRMAIIRSRIQDALVYPREARRRGIEGTAEVRFDMREDGRLRSVELAESSGRDVLDDASLETVRRAQPFPFVEGALQVPVVFRLTGN